MNFIAVLLPFFSIIAVVSIGSIGSDSLARIIEVYGQPINNDTAITNSPSGSQFIVNIRGISSFTEENMAVLISTEDDVQAQKVDLTEAVIEPGQENSFSPSKTIDVTIVMNKQVEPSTEVMACVLQLGSGTFSQRINCITVFSEDGNSSESQKIIVPLS